MDGKYTKYLPRGNSTGGTSRLGLKVCSPPCWVISASTCSALGSLMLEEQGFPFPCGSRRTRGGVEPSVYIGGVPKRVKKVC